MSLIQDKIDQMHNAWGHFTDIGDKVEALKQRGQEVDSLFLGQMNKLNNIIDRQQTEVNALKTALLRPNAEKKSFREEEQNMEYKSAFRSYLRRGYDHDLSKIEYKSTGLSGENGSGDMGYSITTRMSDQITDLLEEASVMRKLANVAEISSDSLEMIEDRGITESGWSNEGAAAIESQKPINPTKKIILVHELYAQPKVTQKLLDDNRIDVEEWIGKKLIDAFARKESDAFINGDGNGKPRGILTYPAGREWGKIEQITTITKGEVSTEAIMRLFFSLKNAYATNGKFLVSRNALQMIRLLKDQSSGRYLWSPGLDAANPDQILGAEVMESPDMPEAKSGNIPIAFADFQKAYQIVDRPGIKLLRDPYTGKPYVKYYALKRVGGDVINTNAIKLLMIA